MSLLVWQILLWLQLQIPYFFNLLLLLLLLMLLLLVLLLLLLLLVLLLLLLLLFLLQLLLLLLQMVLYFEGWGRVYVVNTVRVLLKWNPEAEGVGCY